MASGEVNLAAGEISTSEGEENKSDGGKIQPAVGVNPSGGKGLAIQPKIGVSAGVDVTGTATLSIPDTAAAIGEAVGDAIQEIDAAITACMKDPGVSC